MARTEKVTVYLEPEVKAAMEKFCENDGGPSATLSHGIQYIILRHLLDNGFLPAPEDATPHEDNRRKRNDRRNTDARRSNR